MDREHLHADRVVNAGVIGRSDVAWRFTYADEPTVWVTDVGGGNPQAFSRKDLQGVATDLPLDVELLTEYDDSMTADGLHGPSFGDLADIGDESFPGPVATFDAGRVWLAEAVRTWQAEMVPPTD